MALNLLGRSVSGVAIVLAVVTEFELMLLIELKVFLDPRRRRIHLISGKADVSCCC